MRANAKYVREGALGYVNAAEFYKEVRRCVTGHGGAVASVCLVTDWGTEFRLTIGVIFTV